MVNALKPQEIKATGWNDGMCQDYCKPLSQWLSSRMDARYTFHTHTLPHTASPKDAETLKPLGENLANPDKQKKPRRA